MVGTKLRKIAALSIWLQLGAFGYLIVWEDRTCSGLSCRPWTSQDAEFIVMNSLLYGVPILVLGILLWRGSLVGAVLAIASCVLVMLVSGAFAFVFLSGADWGLYPFWVVPFSPLVVPGELALVTLFLIGVAFIPPMSPQLPAGAARGGASET